MTLKHKDLHWDESGQSFLTGELADYFARLESALLTLALRNGCHAVQPPSTLSMAMLEKLDYLHSFPQHATFACCLEKQHDNIANFAAQPLLGDDRINITRLAPVRALLLPAACYSVYPTLRSQSRDAKPELVTIQSRCFRSESDYSPLERQWNFSMRELICAGNAEQTQRFHGDVRAQIIELCRALDLDVELQSATDSFFNPARNPKYIMQRIAPSKTEVLYRNTLAIASLNFHRQYFGETFALRHGDDFCFTACVAFGMERWLAALLRQHGSDIGRWPRINEIVEHLPYPQVVRQEACTN
jgi:seryl-tRNA synthetase